MQEDPQTTDALIAGQVRSLEALLKATTGPSSSSPEQAKLLADLVAVVRQVLEIPGEKRVAWLEVIYLLQIASDDQIAMLLHSNFHHGAIESLRQAFNKAHFDVERLDSLPKITKDTGAPGVYIHYGNPRSIDGENSLPAQKILVYVGSGMASAKDTTWKLVRQPE